MALRVPATVVIGAIAVVVVTGAFAAIGWRASSATIDAAFWWNEDVPFLLSEGDAAKIGGPLTAVELAHIRQISRTEVERAYKDLRVTITDRHDAFWRVSVVGEPITVTRNRITVPFAMAGQSHVFGPLGGFGSVGFLILAHNAI